MKRYISFFALLQFILFPIYAQNNVTNKFFNDKIEYISFSSSDEVVEKIESFIKRAKENGAEVIIFNLTSLTNALIGNDKTNKQFDVLKTSSATSKKHNFFFFLNIDFSSISGIKQAEVVLKNFKRITKETEFDGFCFTGLDLSSNTNLDFFEDIVVNAMMIKPFLSIAALSGKGNSNNSATNELIKKGIIDFLFDETSNYSIVYNEAIASSSDKLLPYYLKRLQPESFYLLDFSKINNKKNNVVSLKSINKTKMLDSNNHLRFIIKDKIDTLKMMIDGKTLNVSLADWVIPYNYVLGKDFSVSRTGNWIEFRRPFEKRTAIKTYNLLCRTNYPSTVFINDNAVKQYKTGIFFDKIQLKEGLNKLKAEAKTSNGGFVVYEDRVYYEPKGETIEENKLSIDEATVQPNDNLVLTAKDFLTISFNGSKGHKGIVEINPGNFVIECIRKDNKNSSTYQAQISLKNFKKNEEHTIKLILKSLTSNSEATPAEFSLKNKFIIKDEKDFPTLITTNNNSILTYTLAPIRLGAPIRNELPKDVILKSNGIFGEYYRIRLNDLEEGYINNDFVKEAAINTPLPTYFINPISSYSTKTADVIRIPYLENVPFDVYPDPHQNRVIINLYGVKSSSTWIIHKDNLRFIEEVTWQQVDMETYRIYVNLKTPKIWGYEIKQNGKELLFSIKYPPAYNLKSVTPLKGIKISIEAGHGGTNTGAVSLSGIKEKDLNLDLSKKIEKLFKKQGAEVLQVRDADIDMLLLDKRNITTNSDANIHFSIHANASEPVTEFLGASGTSIFYHNSFWAKFSEFVFNELVELKLKPFGSVGSFNYRVTRMSEMPSILVEMAFMSHAEDEEKLADDNFRDKMAQKIYEGLINYLKYMSGK